MFLNWLFGGKRTTNAGGGALGSAATKAGESVNNETAYQVSAVLCGVRVLAESIAQLPLKINKEVDENDVVTRKSARKHELYKKLSLQPALDYNSFQWREIMMVHALTTGTAFSLITRKTDGKIGEILPIQPEMIKVEVSGLNRKYIWAVGENSGKEIQRKDLFILKGFTSRSGELGVNIINTAKEELGLNLAALGAMATIFKQGFKQAGFLISPTPLSESAAKTLKSSWQANVESLQAGGVALLDGGIKYEPMTSKASDSQTLETRRFGIENVARYFNVPASFLHHSDKTSSFASAEQQSINFVLYSLMPWVIRWELAIKTDLLGVETDFYPELVVQGLMRGTAKDRAEFYKLAIQNGWMTPNEVRILENRNPKVGLDETWMPMNMTTPSEQATEDEKNAK